MAIYTEATYGNSSIVKFGGWDAAGIKNGDVSSLRMLQTKSNSEWMLNAQVITQGSQQAEPQQFTGDYVAITATDSSQPRDIFIDPQVSFLYVPELDFTHIIGTIGILY